MRHTRMRQIAKANKDPMWMWKDQVGTDTIELMTRVHGLGLKPKLDKSFEWHREKGSVSYHICDEYESHLSIHSNGI